MPINAEIIPLVPVESQNPVYVGRNPFSDVFREHGNRTLAEVKENGYRIQLHKRRKEVKAFTRQMIEYQIELYPEILEAARYLPDCILDAELHGAEKIGRDAFNSTRKRFRGRRLEKSSLEDYLSSGLVEEFPLSIRVFDVLYWKKPQVDNPIEARRALVELIEGAHLHKSEQRIFNDENSLHSWFDELAGAGYEGIVCKKPGSLYRPGSRTSDWVKIKNFESVDLVVLGVYLENGEISQLLCGPYNAETGYFETLARVNAKRGEMNIEIYGLLAGKFLKGKPKKVRLNPNISENKMPTHFISPNRSVVVEVQALNFNHTKNWHSCGLGENGKSYSTQIGFLHGIRHDKKSAQATTTGQVRLLYEKQNDNS